MSKKIQVTFEDVQIPLWSMNTEIKKGYNKRFFYVQIPLWSMNTKDSAAQLVTDVSSDSSMVDEYASSGIKGIVDFEVQIPLWSMNTPGVLTMIDVLVCSDSSMVDEYANRDFLPRTTGGFRFLYGR